MSTLRQPADQQVLADSLGLDLNHDLLRRALTHRSYAYEHGGLPHNERLEFLGDAVLGIVVTDTLFRAHPDLSEGRLAKLRASVVNMRALAGVAAGIHPDSLGAYLLLGRGEEATGGREKASILADTLEALLGAVYLAQGLDVASRLIHELFDGLLEQAAGAGAGLDWKTSLQELTAQLALGVPDYVMSSEGPDHEKVFTANALIAGELFPPSSGRSKKEAEQLAAETAWRSITARAQARAEADAGADSGGGPASGTSGTSGTTAAAAVADPPTS